jgi:hypothetical protein
MELLAGKIANTTQTQNHLVKRRVYMFSDRHCPARIPTPFVAYAQLRCRRRGLWCGGCADAFTHIGTCAKQVPVHHAPGQIGPHLSSVLRAAHTKKIWGPKQFGGTLRKILGYPPEDQRGKGLGVPGTHVESSSMPLPFIQYLRRAPGEGVVTGMPTEHAITALPSKPQ